MRERCRARKVAGAPSGRPFPRAVGGWRKAGRSRRGAADDPHRMTGREWEGMLKSRLHSADQLEVGM